MKEKIIKGDLDTGFCQQSVPEKIVLPREFIEELSLAQNFSRGCLVRA
jgi:hypothetical protein